MKRFSTFQAGKRLKDILDDAEHRLRPSVITRYNKDSGIVLPTRVATVLLRGLAEHPDIVELAMTSGKGLPITSDERDDVQGMLAEVKRDRGSRES